MHCAGIVLYNPSIERLAENIKAIYNQVDKVVLIDNASSNIDEVCNLLRVDYPKVIIIKNSTNLGIAKALNQICDYAKDNYDWVLLLDQDSVTERHLVFNYTKYLNVPNVAIVTCKIKDRNFDYINTKFDCDYNFVKYAITSGSFINLKIWKRVGGFDEMMFIDGVDTEYCIKLWLNGYKILCLNYNGLLHEVGNRTKKIKVLKKEIVIFNHSPFRCYYIVRNQVYLVRKFGNQLGNPVHRYLSAYNRIIVYLLFEKNKYAKLKAGIKGLIDGHVMHVVKYTGDLK